MGLVMWRQPSSITMCLSSIIEYRQEWLRVEVGGLATSEFIYFQRKREGMNTKL